MPIDSQFEDNREVVDEHEGHKVWGPVDEPIDCMLCVDVCPVDAIDVDPGRAGRI
ncbi:MAG: 4Fe-4S binding protein [Halobacteriaceae archaeon]